MLIAHGLINGKISVQTKCPYLAVGHYSLDMDFFSAHKQKSWHQAQGLPVFTYTTLKCQYSHCGLVVSH